MHCCQLTIAFSPRVVEQFSDGQASDWDCGAEEAERKDGQFCEPCVFFLAM